MSKRESERERLNKLHVKCTGQSRAHIHYIHQTMRQRDLEETDQEKGWSLLLCCLWFLRHSYFFTFSSFGSAQEKKYTRQKKVKGEFKFGVLINSDFINVITVDSYV